MLWFSPCKYLTPRQSQIISAEMRVESNDEGDNYLRFDLRFDFI